MRMKIYNFNPEPQVCLLDRQRLELESLLLDWMDVVNNTNNRRNKYNNGKIGSQGSSKQIAYHDACF